MVYLIQNHNALADEQSRPLLLQLLDVSTFFCANHWFTGGNLVRNDFVSGIWSVSLFGYGGFAFSAIAYYHMFLCVSHIWHGYESMSWLLMSSSSQSMSWLFLFIYLLTFLFLLMSSSSHYCITDSFSWSEHCFSFYFRVFYFHYIWN